MNVLVIGAAGETGKLVVERALAAGHAVTAFVQDPGSYRPPPGVARVEGSFAAGSDFGASVVSVEAARGGLR